jgi:hypothetical protein
MLRWVSLRISWLVTPSFFDQRGGDREALLANPGAIKIPLEQLAAGREFVLELSGVTVVCLQ